MLITLLVLLVICGVLLWAVPQLPIDPTIAQVIRVVIVVAVVLYAVRLLAPGHVPL